MDFVSLDMDLVGKQMTPNVSTTSEPFHKTLLFKAIALLCFLVVVCFPQPNWLNSIISHPIGSILLASIVGISLLPEIDWWIIVLSLIVAYCLLQLTNIIENNLEEKRQINIKKEEMSQEKTKKDTESKTEDTPMIHNQQPRNLEAENELMMLQEPASRNTQLPEYGLPMIHEPMAANA